MKKILYFIAFVLLFGWAICLQYEPGPLMHLSLGGLGVLALIMAIAWTWRQVLLFMGIGFVVGAVYSFGETNFYTFIILATAAFVVRRFIKKYAPILKEA